MLKADLHIHTSEDPRDQISYSAKELIDYARILGFDVIAITNHGRVTYNKGLENYAKKRGILLIPGVEINVEGADVLIYNVTQKDVENIKSLSDLEKFKKRGNVLIAAPHPYYSYRSLGKMLERNISLFDAVEYCHFYLKWMNLMNKKAARIAHKHNKPLIGSSDAHHLWRMNTTYTLINSKKNINCAINAIKKGDVKVISQHLSLLRYIKALSGTLFGAFSKRLKTKKIKNTS